MPRSTKVVRNPAAQKRHLNRKFVFASAPVVLGLLISPGVVLSEEAGPDIDQPEGAEASAAIDLRQSALSDRAPMHRRHVQRVTVARNGAACGT